MHCLSGISSPLPFSHVKKQTSVTETLAAEAATFRAARTIQTLCLIPERRSIAPSSARIAPTLRRHAKVLRPAKSDVARRAPKAAAVAAVVSVATAAVLATATRPTTTAAASWRRFL